MRSCKEFHPIKKCIYGDVTYRLCVNHQNILGIVREYDRLIGIQARINKFLIKTKYNNIILSSYMIRYNII